MIKKHKMTPLVLKNNFTSIYFNFENDELYEVKFAGALTRAFAGDQKTNTFFISLILMYIVIPIGGLLLNQFLFHSKLIAIVFSFLIGLAFGYFLVKVVLSEIKEQSIIHFSKVEIRDIAKQAIFAGRVLRITMIFFLLFSVIGLFVSLTLSQREFAKFLFYNGLSGFIIMAISRSSHPKLMIKSGKILKKQLKEGKFDD